MKFAFKIIDKLLSNPTPTNLLLLNNTLTLGIPFNAPHGFKIKQLNADAVVISLPNKKLNHNHLGGVHACAMATVGEFCAGMSILSSFGSSKYRLILAELNVKYSYQGRTHLEGTCLPSQIDKDEVAKSLEKDGKYLQTLTTVIREQKSGKEVAQVTTTWQLKPWELVKTKS
jgi:acyl-coenzyme A thioesterase PaaI-like protein